MKDVFIHDNFGTNITPLKSKKLFLFDMDGTIYKENDLFDGTKSLLSYIDKIGGKYVFITNNSSKSRSEYINKLNNMGIPAKDTHFFTSTQASILYLNNHFSNQSIYCMGTNSMIEELRNANLTIHTAVTDDAGVILIGFDTELNYEKIRNTCEMLRKPIPYLATNPDLSCPVGFGYIPDCGAISKLLECATGRTPFFIGKPEPTMVQYAVKQAGFQLKETVVIGDRLYTDISSGIRAGVTTVCVLTGEATMDEIEHGTIKPDFTFYSVKELDSVLRSL